MLDRVLPEMLMNRGAERPRIAPCGAEGGNIFPAFDSMAKTLIIAEKPSVATDLARVLGKKTGKLTKDKSSAFYANDQLIITSAVGHLLEQKKPQTADGKSLPWKMEYLPVIPDDFDLEPIAKSADRLRKVLQLAKKKEVTLIVNACDAGREGELIFRNIARYAKWKKPMKRLWMQSMTDDSILAAWENLRTDEEMLDLADAAVCRSESDWLVGLNSTRALTVLQSSAGGFNMTPAGRVQTPTLAILAQREQAIRDFVPETYYEVHARFSAQAGEYEGKWIDPNHKRDDRNPQNRPERIQNKETATQISERCQGKTGTVKETKKPVSLPPPLLFDLTSLQREASNHFGFSARRTLQLAQECYEKHKVLTYPRTDSKFLPDDYIKVACSTVAAIADHSEEFSSYARSIAENHSIKKNKRIFDSSKVSDHFAIIPTGHFASLSGDVAKIFRLVLQRFLSVFMPNAEYEDTERHTIISHGNGTDDVFFSRGRIMKSAGWKALYGKTSKPKEELAPVVAGEEIATLHVSVEEDETKPPARYTEATLLSAMEGAGKLVEDEELSAAMKERGLGTPATRASIIEGLISQEYMARDGKNLVTTRKGMDLIALLSQIGVPALASPEMTGEWEYRLKQMEQGKLKRTDFMCAIKDYTTAIVDHVKTYRSKMQETELGDLHLTCPECGEQGLRNTHDAVSCRSCKFRIQRMISGRSLDDEELSVLISKGKLPLMEGFRSRFGKPFSAGLVLNEKHRVEFYFPERDTDTADDGKNAVTRGSFPVLDLGEQRIDETETHWILPDVKCGKDSKKLSLSRTILSKEIPWEQALKLLAEGKSDLIEGFISQRTKKPFDAYLVLDLKQGRVNFEFPPRKMGTKKTTSSVAGKFAKDDPVQEDLSKAVKIGSVKVKRKGEMDLFQTERAWHVPDLKLGRTGRSLAIARQMCGYELTAEDVSRLLEKGKTDLIKGFFSQKSKKNFDAKLVLNLTTGRITYEFPERD